MPNPCRSDSDREKFILRFLPTARRIATCWGNTSDTKEEAVSELSLALVLMVDSTPDEKLTEPYVAESLRNHLRTAYNRSKKLSAIPADKMVSLDQPLPGQEHLEDFETLGDLLPDPNAVNPEAVVISKQFIEAVLIKLTETQRKLVTRHLGLDGMDPVPMDRCARGLRLSRTVAYYEFARAKDIIRVELEAMGMIPETDSDLREMLKAA